ncbi:hypothetical protein [Streptomyces bullii]|uniref:Secreted protein n=1 Tax=Streptomyces bullii TaxID=349910 RepID=A0ABW0UW63_9ACTN
MQKLRKAAAVAAMVGGIGLVGSGVAQADGYHDYHDAFDIFVGNAQFVECEQTFEAGDIAVTGGPGDTEANTGNFCTVIGSAD